MPSSTPADLDAAVEAAVASLMAELERLWRDHSLPVPPEYFLQAHIDPLVAAVTQRERAKYEALVEALEQIAVAVQIQDRRDVEAALVKIGRLARAALRAALPKEGTDG